MAPLAPVLILMAMVALARRAVGPLLVLLAGIVVARAISITGVGLDLGGYGYFAQPAQSFFRRVRILSINLAHRVDGSRQFNHEKIMVEPKLVDDALRFVKAGDIFRRSRRLPGCIEKSRKEAKMLRSNVDGQSRPH